MSICVMSGGDGSVIEASSGRSKVFIRSRDERICPPDGQGQFEYAVRRASEDSRRKSQKVSANFGLIVALRG
jgi:hypothetical protein